ncbi:MAG: thioredoxin family protein [Alphaproteobacteria bacterium]
MVLLTTPICDFDKKIIDFALLNIDGEVIQLKNILGLNGTLVMFICNHCPYVKAILPRLVQTTNELKKIHINSVAIMPNDTKNYPEDSFEQMKIFADKNNFNFPYLIDESQEIARSYGAVCTPEFFGYNKYGRLNYRGRLSEMRNLKFANEKNDLMDAMLMISETNDGPKTQFPSAGCSIKWR